MKNLAEDLRTYWLGKTGLPNLWYEYIPEETGFPCCRFAYEGFNREPTSNRFSIDTYKLEFAVFAVDAVSSFTIGQKALNHIQAYQTDEVVNVRCVPEQFSTPVEAGERTVWGFRFTAEFSIMHDGDNQ